MIKRFLLLPLFFITIYYQALQAHNKIDSLEKLISKDESTDTGRINLFLQLCKEYRNNNMEKSLLYGKRALILSKKNHNE